MKTNQQFMKALLEALDDVRAEIKKGDSGACVELAMGIALYEYLKAGNALTDLSWFKESTYYTGHLKEAKAA